MSAMDERDEELLRWLQQMGLSPDLGSIDMEKLISQMNTLMGSFAPSQSTSAKDSLWSYIRSAVKNQLASEDDPQPDQAFQNRLADAERLVNSWLDEFISFESTCSSAQAWTRSRWIDATLDGWRSVAEPIGARIGEALAHSFTNQLGNDALPTEFQSVVPMLTPLMQSSAEATYAQRFATALSTAANDLLTACEINIPLLSSPRLVVIASNFERFSHDTSIDSTDLLYYICARELARQRLFSHVGWLGPQLMALIEHYAREIVIDPSAFQTNMSIEEISQMDMETLEGMRINLEGKLFSPEKSDLQREILDRLETLLALIEGWVDQSVSHMVAKWMPHAHAHLDEMMRRRRATDDPARRLFEALVGLELHPKKVRQAVQLWTTIATNMDVKERDALWAHPDLIPTSSDLDHPEIFRPHQEEDRTPDAFDEALARLLEEADPHED